MKPKIVTFCPLPPTITGGIEEYAYSVIDEMRSKGYPVLTVTAQFNDNTKYPESNEGYFYISSFSLWKRPVPKNIFSLLRIVTIIRNSDIVHIHMPYPFLESFATITAKLFKKKVVVTYHADARIDDGSSSSKLALLYSFVEKAYVWLSAKWALSPSDVICTNTMAYAASSKVLNNYINKITVIHQGIKADLYKHLDYSKAGEMRSNYTKLGYSHIVTFVGRLVPYKGLPYLIHTIKILEGDNNNILFVIGGSGPEKDNLVNMVNSYDLKNVKFIGFVPDEILFNLFAASDLVVSPSISNLESTPISLLCALSTGTPVIGTEVGGTAETIPNDEISGSVIPAGDSKKLAEAILKLLNIKRSGRVEIPQNRYWSHVANDYLELMTNMVTSGQSKVKNGLVQA